MSERPVIPHDTGHGPMEAKRWTRKLAEAGKLSGRPAEQIPHYGRTDEPPEDVA
ncbi:MAG: hypothetical protein ABUJ98_14775 [Hyphomicrobium sp.]